MNNKPKKYSARLDFRCTPELKHAFTTAQAINKDKFTEFLINACNKFISKYSSVHDVVRDGLNDGVVHDETDKFMTYGAMNDDVRRDEIKVNQNNDDAVRDDGVLHDENDDVRRDEIQLTDSEISDLLLNSEFDPNYKAKAKALKRFSMKQRAESLYQEHLTQAELERRAAEVLQAEIFN